MVQSYVNDHKWRYPGFFYGSIRCSVLNNVIIPIVLQNAMGISIPLGSILQTVDKNNMQTFYRIGLICCVILLAGCQLIPVYRPDIQQGNIITQDQVSQLHIGMRPAQVLYVMGPPILRQNFIRNRWDYVYTLKKPHKKMIEKRLTLYFENDRLVHMTGVELPPIRTGGPVLPQPWDTKLQPGPYAWKKPSLIS